MGPFELDRIKAQVTRLKRQEAAQTPPVLSWEYGCNSIDAGWRQIFAAQWLTGQPRLLAIQGGNMENAIKMLQMLVRDTFPKLTTHEGPEPDWRQIHVVAIWFLAVMSPFKPDILPSVQHACQVANLVVNSEQRQIAIQAFDGLADVAKPILGDLWRD